MAQTLKTEVRLRLLEAAERAFAEHGYERATMADIASRAALSTGNSYRYFTNKDALFDEVVSDAFADDFLRLVSRRVASLVQASDLRALDTEAQRDADELLRFWVENRRKVIILLDRADGSRQANFVDRFVEVLLRAGLAKVRGDAHGTKLPPPTRFLLEQIFRNTVRTLVAILESHEDDASIRHAFQGFWSYQLAGLAGFTEWVNA